MTIFLFILIKYFLLVLILLAACVCLILIAVIEFHVQKIQLFSEFYKRGKLGLLVYSKSAKWQTYVEEEILPHLTSDFLVLNYAERHQWERKRSLPLEVRAFRKLMEGHQGYSPAVLVVSSNRQYTMISFHRAIKRHKQGNSEELRRNIESLKSEIDRAKQLRMR